MATIFIPPAWRIPDQRVTPESTYRSRREFLREMGFLGAAAVTSATAYGQASPPQEPTHQGWANARRNPEFDPKWTLSQAEYVFNYNNFYEFSTQKDRVVRLVDKFVIDPWSIEVGGLCEKPMKLDVRELATQFPMEERVYRFRCVEAWAMIVPWTGFPLSKLIEKVQPKSNAKFVRFVTAMKPNEMPGILRLADYPWPYTEGLRLDEATNPLTLVATGLYGKPLPKQNGAPVRLVVPWKYGYKSIKSIVKIEFVASQPATLWETLGPDEYPFESNVNPKVDHPRWSQAMERMIDTRDRVPTQLYNGYADYVAKLYPKA